MMKVTDLEWGEDSRLYKGGLNLITYFLKGNSLSWPQSEIKTWTNERDVIMGSSQSTIVDLEMEKATKVKRGIGLQNLVNTVILQPATGSVVLQHQISEFCQPPE